MLRRLFCVNFVFAILASPTFADQAVTDWNWLQLPPSDVVHFVGNNAGALAEPDMANLRIFVGDFIWIPDGALTNSGAGDYFAGVQFPGTQREVENVRVQWWANEGTSIQAGDIEGSTDGVNYTNIGSFDYGSPQTGVRFFANVDVADGNYSHVRVHMQPGDYTFGNPSRGGPGIFSIEPFGDGSLREDKVNWANNDFGTSVSNVGLDFNGTRYNDGDLYDDEGARTGNENWDPGDYLQINLGTIRELNQLVGVWDFIWHGTAFDIATSTDGTNFFPVQELSAPTQYAASGDHGATGYTFKRHLAQYVRISNGTGGPPYELFNQVLVFTPEPSTSLMALLGGMALVSFRKRFRAAR